MLCKIAMYSASMLHSPRQFFWHGECDNLNTGYSAFTEYPVFRLSTQPADAHFIIWAYVEESEEKQILLEETATKKGKVEAADWLNDIAECFDTLRLPDAGWTLL